jgi:polyhydroxyalkanoate synthesis regulator phasin
MFDHQKMMNEFVNASKTQWNLTMEMFTNFQSQWEQSFNTMIDHGHLNQREGLKMMGEWVKRAKEAREEFKKKMDDNWKNLEDIMNNASGKKTGK